MYIEKIIIEGIPPISGSISLECDDRVNLLIGPNASGKSTILRAIEYVYSQKEDHPMSAMLGDGDTTYIRDGRPHVPLPRATLEPNEFSYDFDRGPPFCRITVSNDWPRGESKAIGGGEVSLNPTRDCLPLLAIPGTRVGLSLQPGPSDLEQMLELYREQVNIFLQMSTLVGDGEQDSEQFQHLMDRLSEIHRAINNDPLESLFGTNADVFYGHHVKTAIDANRAQQDRQYHQHDYYKALQLGYSCARRICAEIIHDFAPHPFLELPEGVAYQNDQIVQVVHPNMGIGTIDVISGAPLYVGALSSGTQGTLLWIYALALKMALYYDWKEGWEKEPAILLIDEIENHLHPTWQRRVIPALLDQFPKLQIFATTHSPFVVAGLKAGQVHLLKRGGSGGVSATTNAEDVVGWTSDEVLRNMMGVEDPTDEGTAAAARELRELRKEGPRSSEQTERQRQERLEELRQRVNRDLLAGGPEAAQREEFEQQFAEALQSYQKSQSLDQDSG